MATVRTASVLCAAAIVIVSVSPGIGCKQKTPEDRARETIEAIQKAAKAHRPSGVLDYITLDFSDNHGNGRDTLKALLLREMLANKNLGVYITTDDITFDGKVAGFKASAIVTGSSGWIPEKADRLNIDGLMREEDGKFKVFKADWTLGPR